MNYSHEYRARHRAWASPSEVEPGSGTADQLDLLRDLVAGRVDGRHFAAGWYDARRRGMDAGERAREPFDRLLQEVFYLLEEYVIDPSLRAPDDMSDEALIQQARTLLDQMHALDGGRRTR